MNMYIYTFELILFYSIQKYQNDAHVCIIMNKTVALF